MSAVPETAAARPVLDVQDLHVEFDTYGGIVKAVRGVSFSVPKAKTLAIVGESGCGKSVSVQSIMGLIPTPPGRITRGTALFGGVDIIRQKIVDGHDVPVPPGIRHSHRHRHAPMTHSHEHYPDSHHRHGH